MSTKIIINNCKLKENGGPLCLDCPNGKYCEQYSKYREKHKDELKAPYDTFGAPIIKVKGIGILKEVHQTFKLEENESKNSSKTQKREK